MDGKEGERESKGKGEGAQEVQKESADNKTKEGKN